MHRRCAPALAALLLPGCGEPPPAPNEPPPATIVKIAAPRVLALDTTGLTLDDHRVQIAAPADAQAVLAVALALAERLPAGAEHPAPYDVTVAPDTRAAALTTLVAASRGRGVAWRFTDDKDAGEAVALSAQGVPPADTEPAICLETGVVIGRGTTWVGNFTMEVAPGVLRRSSKPAPNAGITASLDGRDPTMCQKLGGLPQHLDRKALVDAVAAVRPTKNTCGPALRVAVDPGLEWSRFAGLLRALGAAGHPLALVDASVSDFAECGAGAFAIGPAFPLDLRDKAGPLEEPAIRQVFDNHAAESDECVALAGPDEREERRTHPVSAEIQPDGAIAAASPFDAADPVARCLADAIRRWRFPMPRAPAPVTFTVTY